MSDLFSRLLQMSCFPRAQQDALPELPVLAHEERGLLPPDQPAEHPPQHLKPPCAKKLHLDYKARREAERRQKSSPACGSIHRDLFLFPFRKSRNFSSSFFFFPRSLPKQAWQRGSAGVGGGAVTPSLALASGSLPQTCAWRLLRVAFSPGKSPMGGLLALHKLSRTSGSDVYLK